MRRPEEDVPDVKEGEGEKCLNEVTPKRNVELHVHVVPDLDHCEFAIASCDLRVKPVPRPQQNFANGGTGSAKSTCFGRPL